MSRSKIIIKAVLFLSGMLFFSCKKSDNSGNQPVALKINSLSVVTGPYNTNVVITGTGFHSTATEDLVSFNGKSATVTTATTTQLTVTVPKGAGTGAVKITVGTSTATGPTFTYQLTATVSTLAGNDKAQTIDGVGTNASFNIPFAITTDKNGNVYVADEGDNVIRKITPAGVVTTLAGSGIAGYADGTGIQASFNTLYGLVADSQGNVFVADHENGRIRKITPAGVVTTFAGSGATGSNDGTGSAASFQDMPGLTIDSLNNLYVIDSYVIRKITPAAVVTTLHYSTGMYPRGIAIDGAGNFYIADGQQDVVTKISNSGASSTFAGSGKDGSANGIGIAASFWFVNELAVDKSGNLYVSDLNNQLLRKITPAGAVTTVAGLLNVGVPPTVDGPANTATFYSIQGVAIDPTGIIYVCEPGNHRIRKIVLE